MTKTSDAMGGFAGGSEISFHTRECWSCLSTENLTRHHAIPKRMNPQKNLVIPICRTCHNKINGIDVVRDPLVLIKKIELLEANLKDLKEDIQTRGVEEDVR